MDEFSFINWIRKATQLDPGQVPVGPGDDCAVLRIGGELLLVTTDQCADGVHFALRECGPEQAGYKVMARNLSDIAAMGGEPIAAVATVALPKGLSDDQVKALYVGMRRAGDAFGCPIVGGDISAWDNPLHMSVTMFGRPIGKEPVLRSGARAGDAVCVTGTLGGSLPSGKHLNFTPRLAAARELVKRYPITSMIDISDGLGSDMGHICDESHVAAELIEKWIPLSDAARQAPDPLASALSDGEDYELLFTLPVEYVEPLIEEQPLDVAVTWIGRTFEGDGVWLVSDSDGESRRIDPKGFQHRT